MRKYVIKYVNGSVATYSVKRDTDVEYKDGVVILYNIIESSSMYEIIHHVDIPLNNVLSIEMVEEQ